MNCFAEEKMNRLLWVLETQLKLSKCEVDYITNPLAQGIHNFVRISSLCGFKKDWHCTRCDARRKTNPYVP